MRKLIILSVLSFAAACKGTESKSSTAQAWSPAELKSVRGIPAAEIKTALQQRISQGKPAQLDEDEWNHALRLYKIYGNNPLWLTNDGLHDARTTSLTKALINAEGEGMRMDVYPIGALAKAIVAAKADKPTAAQLADADVLLTASYAALGEDMLTGQVKPKSVNQSWHIDPQEENVDSALVRNLRVEALDKSLATMRPADDDYAELRKQLVRYRAILAKGGWKGIPAVKPVKPGQPINPAVAAALRARLAAEGILASDSSANTNNSVYDKSLAAAVAEFQTRHTIGVDSMLGKETVDALNQSAAYRLTQVVANMERYRWLPRALGSRYIFVNVPAFKLEAYDKGELALVMKVIVGQEYEDKATPVFADSMETVVFRPYWNVTPDIAEKEIFPKASAEYMAANNYEIYMEGGARRIRQRPGPKNSLGLVKFLFPNDFNIYLHDTPNHELFKEDVRAFSHGCIRLEKPDKLAEFVLGWDNAKVKQSMENGPDNKTVKLPTKLPVYIVYATTFMVNNQLHFGNDLYNRDDALVKAVAPAAMPSAEVVQSVQALKRIAER
jgi:murein L,D-transpeptidase YcbB/YkuD